MNIIDEDDGPLVSRCKAEQLEGGAFADVEEARMETFIFIESYYNRVRLNLRGDGPQERQKTSQVLYPFDI